jgi:hypothetical protein
MSQPADDRLPQGSEERLKLLREIGKLKKEVEMFQKNEEQLTSSVKSLETKVDSLEEEKYKLMEELSSVKCDLNIKETESKRSLLKMNQMREQCLALEDRYVKQKEKLQKVVSSEKEFYKALQEVLDYYYDSLIKYSRFTTRMLYKLMVNEGINIQQDLKEDFSAKMNTLKIITSNIDIPSVKVNKNTLFRNLQQRVAFFQDIDFDKTQFAFDRLLEEMKSQGVKLEVKQELGDMTLMMDGSKAGRYSKRNSSMLDDTSILNESIGDANTSQTFFLADLDKDLTMNYSGVSKIPSYPTLGEHLNSLKSQMKFKPEEGPDYQNLNKVLKEVTDFVDFLSSNVDYGNDRNKVIDK